MGLHEIKKLLHIERNYTQNEKTTYSMGEDICKQYIWRGVNIQNIQRMSITQCKEKKLD